MRARAAELPSRAVDVAASPVAASARLRNAGPVSSWEYAQGSDTHVMLFDADKDNPFQRTQYYVVEVGWYERVWYTAWSAAQKIVWPTTRFLTYAMGSGITYATLQREACALGFEANEPGVSLCASATLSGPATMTFQVPYMDTDVPASQWQTTYYWRFAAFNGSTTSGWTSWSSFYRAL